MKNKLPIDNQYIHGVTIPGLGKRSPEIASKALARAAERQDKLRKDKKRRRGQALPSRYYFSAIASRPSPSRQIRLNLVLPGRVRQFASSVDERKPSPPNLISHWPLSLSPSNGLASDGQGESGSPIFFPSGRCAWREAADTARFHPWTHPTLAYQYVDDYGIGWILPSVEPRESEGGSGAWV